MSEAQAAIALAPAATSIALYKDSSYMVYNCCAQCVSRLSLDAVCKVLTYLSLHNRIAYYLVSRCLCRPLRQLRSTLAPLQVLCPGLALPAIAFSLQLSQRAAVCATTLPARVTSAPLRSLQAGRRSRLAAAVRPTDCVPTVPMQPLSDNTMHCSLLRSNRCCGL